MTQEKHSRTIAKTISWRILASLTTILLVWIFSGDFTIAISVGLVEALLKMVIYYFHERLWTYTNWGVGPEKRRKKVK